MGQEKGLITKQQAVGYFVFVFFFLIPSCGTGKVESFRGVTQGTLFQFFGANNRL